MPDSLPLDTLQTLASGFFFFGVMFIVTLAIVIVIHELGHYIAARLCGVHIETFAFGFGKELFGFGGGPFKTRWSVCRYPLGGFVKLFGDVDPNNPLVWDHKNDCARTLSAEELEVSFCTKTVWQRIFVVAAGPAINIMLTFLIFLCTFTTYGQRSKWPVITAIAVDSPAHKAGIEIGDFLLEMDGKKIRRLEDIHDITWYENPPEPHTYKIRRDHNIISKTFSARRIVYTDKKGVPQEHGQTGMVRMGAVYIKDIKAVQNTPTEDKPEKARMLIAQNFDKIIQIALPFRDESKKEDFFMVSFPSDFNKHLNDPDDEDYDTAFFLDPEDQFFIRLNVIEAVQESLFSIKKMSVDSYKLVSVAYKGKTDEPVIGGIGKISEQTGKAAKDGLYDYIMFVAAFSLMIAFINLLPIPVLDGGFLVFLSYEAITGHPVSPRIQDIAMIIGLVLLGGIMIIANVSDLIAMLGGAHS